MTDAPQKRQCKGKSKDGKRCANNVIPGTSSCYIKAHGSAGQGVVTLAVNFFDNHRVLAGLAWASIIVTLIMAVATIVWRYHDRTHATTSGTISVTATANQAAVMIGGTRFLINTKRGVLFAEGPNESSLLAIRLEGDKLLVSTHIFDDSGNLIAELKDNVWNHQPRPAIFDRNYTNNTLEIRGPTGDVVLQVASLGKDVYFAGVLQCKSGSRITITPDPVSGGAVLGRVPRGSASAFSIEPICDYPSDLHLGSCPGLSSLKIPSASSGGLPIYAPLYFCQ